MGHLSMKSKKITKYYANTKAHALLRNAFEHGYYGIA